MQPDRELVERLNQEVFVKGSDLNGDGPQEEVLPPFPDDAWMGLFRAYRDLVGATTEAPDVYHFFSFALAFGSSLGRRLYVMQAVPIYPNWFVSLVGRTGLARKDTARKRATDLMTALNQEELYRDQPKFVSLPGLGSAEGLLDQMAGEGKIVVAQEAELLSLMSKAKRDATANIIPHLTTLFDCPDLHRLPTRMNPVVCKNTFLSLLCGTTPVWLRKSLSEDDAYGGFANRFVFVFGGPKDPIAWPATVDKERWGALVQQVNEVRRWAQFGDDASKEHEVQPTRAAIERFTEWYFPYYRRCSGEGLLCALAVRFQGFAWKLALLYAAQVRSPLIEEDHLTPALSVVDWLWESNRAAFAEFVGHGRGMEQHILDWLTERGPMSKRLLYRGLKVSAVELERALEPLSRLGLIQACEIKTDKGVTAPGYQVNT